MTDEHTARVRMYDLTKDPQFSYRPPDVVWLCPKRHRMMRVFRLSAGWHLLSDRFPVPTQEWLDRIGSDWTADDVKEGRVVAFNEREVVGVNKMLPLDIDTWPAVRFKIGCSHTGCKPVWVGLEQLAEDCRRALDERRTITNKNLLTLEPPT